MYQNHLLCNESSRTCTRPPVFPPRGLRFGRDWKQVGAQGLGDPFNAYAHSMAWFEDRLYVGTTRSNLCMLKQSQIQSNILIWPVNCPENLYDLDMRARILRYSPRTDIWEEVYASPMITALDGTLIPRELGFRSMLVFQGTHDPKPVLYAAGYASARSEGPMLLRSENGLAFEPVSRAGLVGLPITTIRILVAFQNKLYTSPTGKAKGNVNTSHLPIVYESEDPKSGHWIPVNEPGFGNPDNLVIFEMARCGEHLYAGTANLKGYEIWRTRGEGTPPYQWERVLTQGAYRGKLNQGVASMAEFRGALYVGSGIQHGGIDRSNRIGPAGPELIRIHPDTTWDLIVGHARETPDGPKEPLSGFLPGFNNFFNGYFWRMEVHEGWLYLGTFDWSLMLRFADEHRWPPWFRRIVKRIGIDKLIANHSGFDLYRSFDGENWLPVSVNGFDNPYNYGLRSLTSTPEGFFLGSVNPFAPQVATQKGQDWVYEDNPRGGLEVWLGKYDAQSGDHAFDE